MLRDWRGDQACAATKGSVEASRARTVNAKRWVVVRSFAWAARFRRLARGFERS